MRIIIRPILRVALVAATFGGAGALTAIGGGAATPDNGAPIGHVYVDDNTTGSNSVSAFSRDANGTLVPLPDSPVAIGGAGTGTGSQGSLQETPDGRYLLAVDAGSNQISVLRIKADGDLVPVAGAPVSSGGIKPVSIAIDPISGVHGGSDLVYVANAGTGTGGSNYTGFTLGGTGILRPLPGSTVALPDAASPGDVLFNGSGTNLAGTRVGTQQIDSFSVGRDGLLTAAPGSPFNAQGPGPIGSEFRPTNPSQLFVSNAHGGTDNGTVSAFDVSRNGTLTSIGAGPFADDQTAPCWVEITHDGRYLFAVNTAVPSISRYAIAADGALTLIGSTPLSGAAELAPVDARLTPNGSTLYVVDGGGVSVSAFAVHGGNLHQLASSPTPLPAGSSPVGIVVN